MYPAKATPAAKARFRAATEEDDCCNGAILVTVVDARRRVDGALAWLDTKRRRAADMVEANMSMVIVNRDIRRAKKTWQE